MFTALRTFNEPFTMACFQVFAHAISDHTIRAVEICSTIAGPNSPKQCGQQDAQKGHQMEQFHGGDHKVASESQPGGVGIIVDWFEQRDSCTWVWWDL